MRGISNGAGPAALLAAFVALSAAAEAESQTAEASTSLDFERCLLNSGPVSVDAECATLILAENPSEPDGKTIELFVARIPARNANPEPDPFTVIQGGPGGSSVDLYISQRGAFAEIRNRRDILLVDQRGTGRSNKLSCPVPDAETMASTIEPEAMRRLAEECLPTLSGDPRYYTTSIAVQDLDAVREAAGYEQLNIYGVSYGTRVAQHYLRRFPERTRAVIIDGVAPVDWVLGGGDVARFSQRAFDAMQSRCNEDTACRERFGDLSEKFAAVRERLALDPQPVSLPHPSSGELITETVYETHLLMVARLFPYSTEQLALLPLLIDEAYKGNYQPLAAQAASMSDTFDDWLAMGMHNAVVCAEDLPFLNRFVQQDLDQTYLGRTVVDGLRAVCDVWPRGVTDEDFKEPFESTVPVLILSGETDPITPPDNGDEALKMLANARHLTVPAHGHGVIGRGCVPQLAAQFVNSADHNALDPSCIERERPMPFFFSFAGPQP